MISASGLMRNCGYPRRLARESAPSEAMEYGAGIGREFHGAIEAWAVGRDPLAGVSHEARGLLELLMSTGWRPTPRMVFEAAVGLDRDGRFAAVTEPAPHVYEGRNLLTAGRADWIEVDIHDTHGEIAVIGDWKTSKSPPNPRTSLQLTALGLAACQWLDCDGFRRVIYRAREGIFEMDEGPIARDSLDWQAAFSDVKAAAELDEEPRPGGWCGTCWEQKKRRCSKGRSWVEAEKKGY